MDPTALLAYVPTQYLPYVTAAVTICSLVVAFAPAPTTTSGLWYEIYQIINRVALNFGHAQSLAAPESTGIVGGAKATTAPTIAIGAVPLAAATPEQKAVMVPPASPAPPAKP